MDWKKKVCVLGAVLLCTSLMLATTAPPNSYVGKADPHKELVRSVAANPVAAKQMQAAPQPHGPRVSGPAQPNLVAARQQVERNGGDTCATATVIGGLPYVDIGSTVGMVNDYDYACPYTGSTSPDVVYSYTPGANQIVNLNLCVAVTDYDSKLYIYAGACGGVPIACNDDACSSPYYSNYVSQLTGVSLTGGTTYYIVVDGYFGASGSFQINIDELQPCAECPPGGIPEGEPVCYDNYVDATNGGCNSNPNVFSPIDCNQTICGESGVYLFNGLTYRDTDWYQLNLAAPSIVTFDVEAQFGVLMGLIDQITPGVPGCGNITGYIDPYAIGAYCQPVSITTACLQPGTYYFFVAPSSWAALACGTDYVATLTCTPCSTPTGACCMDTVCLITNEEWECDALGGLWFAGQDCNAGFQCPTGCLHRIDLWDCYGDGWNDNTLDVYVNALLMLDDITLLSGTGPVSYFFVADNGDTISTVYSPIGGWPYEPYYYIYDGQGYLIAQDGIAGTDCYVQPTGITAIGNCLPATQGACCYYDATCAMVASEAECINGVWLGLGSNCSQCPCLVACPPGGIPENEPNCGLPTDTVNGGCNSVPPVFTYINCGDTICGSGAFDGGTRDTDWFQISVAAPTIFTWSVEAEFQVVIGLIEPITPGVVGCDQITGYLEPYAVASECTPVSVTTACMPPGDYWFFVGPTFSAIEACPANYVATMTCTPCATPPGACCIDLTCIGTMEEYQCDALGGTWFAGQDCNTFECPSGCLHSVVLWDCYGDGWNGNTLDVLVNAVVMLDDITLGGGYGPATFFFIADTGDTISTVYSPIGGWPYEPYYYIYDGLGFLIGQDGISGTDCYVQPTGITTIGNCVVPTTGACCHPDGTCTITTPEECFDNFLGLGTNCSMCPCMVPCPPDGVPEGEPDCYDNYVDVTNGGCNSNPNVFGTIECNQTVCGRSGVYLFGGSTYRDTDWFAFVADANDNMTFTVEAEFGVVFGLIEQIVPGQPGCANITGYISPYAVGGPCQPLSVNFPVTAGGTYYLFVAPSSWAALPCGAKYNATLTGENCLCGDFNEPPDGLVNADDYYIILDAFGTCLGHIKYKPQCDLVVNNCIDFNDYIAWVCCYYEANGVPWTGPAPKPQRPKQPTEAPTGDFGSPVMRSR